MNQYEADDTNPFVDIDTASAQPAQPEHQHAAPAAAESTYPTEEEHQANIQRMREREQREEEQMRARRDAIQITDALKTSEGAGASYIVYCIRFENQETRRRYSDFYSLRQALCSLLPCYIIPPLPPKNSLSSYAISVSNPSKAKEDAALISRRRRMLGVFLNRCLSHKMIGNCPTFRRFLEPNVPWSEVLHSPPVTLLPKNPLKAAGADPTSPELSALLQSLPIPTSSSTPLQHPDQRFLDSEAFTAKFSSHLSGSLEKVNRRLMKRWHDAAADWGEMGGGMNGFALRMGEEGNGGLEEATEKVGMAVDGGYISTGAMLQAWERTFTEPLAEYTEFSNIIKTLLKYRHLKHLQYEMTRDLLDTKRSTLSELERSELEAQRLEAALERVRVVGDDGGTESAVPRTNPAAGEVLVNPLPASPTISRRGTGGLLGALTHTFQGIVDVDPELTRRNSIGKTKESIHELEEGLKALTVDLRYTSQTIQADLDRFQRQKVADIREMCLEFARFHREWAAKNLALWEDARAAIEAIED